MAIFTMSDLHLSLDTDKSMEVFGQGWDNYISRIKDNWHRLIDDKDTVLVGGDISWAMFLKDCKKDFEFINSLPGRKLLFKGNHDYWWESLSKMNAFLLDNGFDTISFVHNSAVIIEDSIIYGSRGWNLPSDPGFGTDDEKIYKRELARLELSMKHGEELICQNEFEPKRRICVLHYPPFDKEKRLDEGIASLIKKYGVTDCFYGHLHSLPARNAPEGMFEGVRYTLVSADHLGFVPVRV